MFESLHTGMFEGLGDLVELDIYANLISYIEHNTFTPLRKLLRLTAWGNQLTALDQCMLSGLLSLSDLNLSRNRLKTIENNTFHGFEKLHHLDVSNNLLTAIHMDTFSGLKNLEDLHISKNLLSFIHERSFEGMSKYLNLDIYSNRMNCTCDYISMISRWVHFEYTFFYRQLDFSSESGVANEILENYPKSC